MSLAQLFRSPATPFGGWWREAHGVWRQMPNRAALVTLLAAWVTLFHFLGNSTLGYVHTPSLFGWWFWVYSRVGQAQDGSLDIVKILTVDEAYAWFVPFVVLALLWCKRAELAALPKRVSWPALGVLVAAVMVHVLGFMVQQTRISVAAFALGVYGLTGLFWGGAWLRATLFPFSLLALCVPLGSAGEMISFPLRQLSTRITSMVCHVLLGINVIQDGTRLFDAGGSYQYEVAAACSGIRSLTAIVALGVIYGYVTYRSLWRRLALVLAAFPLAVVGNVFRLSLIILSAEAFGQRAGNYVHENSWFSLAPYLPAIGGMLFLGWCLRDDREERTTERGGLAGLEPKS